MIARLDGHGRGGLLTFRVGSRSEFVNPPPEFDGGVIREGDGDFLQDTNNGEDLRIRLRRIRDSGGHRRQRLEAFRRLSSPRGVPHGGGIHRTTRLDARRRDFLFEDTNGWDVGERDDGREPIIHSDLVGTHVTIWFRW